MIGTTNACSSSSIAGIGRMRILALTAFASVLFIGATSMCFDDDDAFATEGEEIVVDDMVYVVLSDPASGGNGTVQVGNGSGAAYSGSSSIITVPAEITKDSMKYDVTAIGDMAFYKCADATLITIPGSVESIGDYAFFGCASLTSFCIPENVSDICDRVFRGCSSPASIVVSPDNNEYASEGGVLFNKDKTELIQFPEGKSGDYTVPATVRSILMDSFYQCMGLTSITIPGNVDSIGEYAFGMCSALASVTLSEGMQSIGDGVFYHCRSITSVYIPASVTSIGEGVFNNCSMLSRIDVASSSDSYSSEDGVLFDKDRTTLIQYPMTRTGEYDVPVTVSSISRYAFYMCHGLTSVNIDPSSGNYCSEDGVLFDKDRKTLLQFPCGGVGDYVVPDTVSTIKNTAFDGCVGLKTVALPASVTEIGDSSFVGCINLSSIDVDGDNECLHSDDGVLFNGTELMKYPAARVGEYRIPGSVTQVGFYAFADACLSPGSEPDPGKTIAVRHHDFDAEFVFSDDCRTCHIVLKCSMDGSHVFDVTVANEIGDGVATATFAYGSEVFTRSVPFDDRSDDGMDEDEVRVFVGIGVAAAILIAGGAAIFLRRR